MTALDTNDEKVTWEGLSHEEKNYQLYLKQKELLDLFLKKGAISKEQYKKSLTDLTLKMGYCE